MQRACGAILQDGLILMVHHHHDGHAYWTLPGGGVEPGETPGEAAIREVREETGLETRIDRLLFEDREAGESCYLLTIIGSHRAALGLDPEQQHLPPAERILQGVGWFTLHDKREDVQVRKVIAALG